LDAIFVGSSVAIERINDIDISRRINIGILSEFF
jgi:hypothetical protein